MKFATHVLCFGQDKWLMKNIQNAYPHVDKIYIAYSDKPWNYNPNARNLYTIPMDLSIIRNSIYADKIEIIEGVWDTEEAQRNACLDFAKKDNIDFLFIHDADEFYTHEDFQKMIQWISSNPQYSLYRCPWYNFWRSSEYITIKEDGNLIAGYPDICINLNHNIRFQNKRTATKDNIGVIDNIICYHMSYVLTDEEVKRKLETWGHTNDFDIYSWYQNKWLSWNENSVGLHPIQPNAWYKAVKYNGVLPEVLI
jgi:hypothetical protein